MKAFLSAAVIAAAITTGLVATPAFADCAGDITKINEAMTKAQLDEANTAKAKELMDKATAAQAANDEANCVAATKELMPLVGLNAG
jgi:hypothetical protein